MDDSAAEIPSRSHSHGSLGRGLSQERGLIFSPPPPQVAGGSQERRQSTAWESLNLILKSCPSSPKTQSRISSLSKRRSIAWDSLSAIKAKFPPTPDLGEEHDSLQPGGPNTILPRSSMVRNSLSLLQSRFPPTSNPDHSGIYEKIMGSKRKSAVQCLRDCQPLAHDCDACACTSSPISDWVG